MHARSRQKGLGRVIKLFFAMLSLGITGCSTSPPRPPVVSPATRDSVDFAIGQGASIRIRGGTSISGADQPLYYVDGIRLRDPFTNFSALANIKPEDIARVEIIEGSAAARLYGTDASNGVILIFSKDFVEVPEVGEFPEPRLKFRLGGNRELALAYVESLLREGRIPWANREDEPLLYVITWLIPEPRLQNESRDRRASVMLRLNENAGTHNCSDVALSWLRKSKGEHERTWRATDEDQQRGAPPIIETIARWLESDKLVGGCH